MFNYLLIGGNFGFPALGIQGAALATVLGFAVAAVMSIASVCKMDDFISIPYIFKNKIKPSFGAFKSLVNIGSGVFAERMLTRIGFMSTALMAAAQGTPAMAAHQVAMNLMNLTFSFGDGLQATAVALIGYSLGARDPEKAKDYGKICRMIGGVISVILGLMYLFGGRALYSLFFVEEIIGYGVDISKVLVFTAIFQVSQVVYMGCLRGAGDTAYTAAVSTISVTVVRTAISWFCSYVLHWGIIGVWMGILADQFGRFVASAIRFKQGKWTKIKI